MGFPIRVLLVEEESAPARELEAACLDAVEGEVVVTVVANAQKATERLAENEFDLVVQDLAGGGVDLFRAIAREHPGVPVTVLAEADEPGVINELLAAARKEDLFGTDHEEPMISFHPRERLSDCIEAIRATLRATAEVAEIAVAQTPPLELSTSESRAIQIFVRRTGATGANVTTLSGGLSGAKTMVIDAADASGMRTAHVVGKLSPVEGIPSAVDGYESAMPYLPAGLGAALAGVVTAGAGNTGAVFYRLADDYRRTYFECLATAPADAATAIRRLHERFADQYAHSSTERLSLHALRNGVVSDEELKEAVAPLPEIEQLEGLEIEASRAIQHRDLHGLNVLVSDSNEPLLIDYDNYATATSALDPLTLELSAFFHRDAGAQEARRSWPSLEQARHWADLDLYLEGCPYPDAIRACRAWAEDAAASKEELWATLWAVALRQLMFENTDKRVAYVLIEVGAAGL